MADTIDYLLRSNIVPSLPEEFEVQQTLKGINNDRLVIENQIENVEKLHDLAEKVRKAYLNVLSPVRRLPLEIIAQFLQLSLPEKMDRDAQICALKRYTVCLTWRQAALITPSLWSVLDIQLDHYVEGNHGELREKAMTGIREWIIRSGSLPLTLSFKGSATSYQHFLPRFVEELPDKISRWKKVTIETKWLRHYESTDLSFFGSLFSSHCAWDMLEHLYLDYPTRMKRAPPIVLNNARNLKRLQLPYMPEWALFAQIPVTPWSQLVELRIWRLTSVPSSLIILDLCRNLQICDISFMSEDDPPHDALYSLPSELPLLLPHLCQLHLSVSADAEIHPFLLSLILPNLNEFTVSCDPLDNLAANSILEFIQTSRCSIHQMKLNCLLVEDDNELARLLAGIPSIVKLELSSIEGINGTFLKRRKVKKALQNLEILLITDARPDFDQFSLKNFAAYCYDQEIVNLKYIKLEYATRYKPDMTILKDKGLTVEINYSEDSSVLTLNKF